MSRSGMLARLLQVLTLSLVAAAVGWFTAWWHAGRPLLAVAGAALLLGGHALVLGLEFLTLRRVHGDDPAPAATRLQLLRAWGAEVLTAALVFCWRQPFRARALPDHLPAEAAGRRGLLLVHGFVCNRGVWNPWLARLRAEGVPCIAVNLEPVFGSIERYVEPLDAAFTRLRQATGLPPVVVAHSMGGLAVRAWWRKTAPGPDRGPHRVVTIGSPHRGTWLGRFGRTPNTRQMALGSEWLRRLRDDEPDERYRHFTCFYSHCDNVVFPPSVATLPGADNRHLPGWSHVHLVAHPQVYAEVRRHLDAAA